MNNDLKERVAHAVGIAALYADNVDRDGRFPTEAISALKSDQLLGIMVAQDCGGESVSLTDIAAICHRLGEACGSTGLIYAMHQIEVALLFPEVDTFSLSFLRRVAEEQLLLASVTSEEGIGGSVRTSACAVEPSNR
jgi:acyl-CoA dehydrogenase